MMLHCVRYISKPSGNIGLYDPAEIHNRHQLSSYMTESMVKLGFHLLLFFFYLYRFDIFQHILRAVLLWKVELLMFVNVDYPESEVVHHCIFVNTAMILCSSVITWHDAINGLI